MRPSKPQKEQSSVETKDVCMKTKDLDRAARSLLKPIWDFGIRSYAQAVDIFLGKVGGPLVGYMARTGRGTDACLKHGALPLPVHFYSPVPDLEQLEQTKAWDRRSELPGVDLRPAAQLSLLAELGSRFGHECDWPPVAPPSSPDTYFTENNSFSFGCSAITHTLIRRLKPRRVIEAGSGCSTRIIAAALTLNAQEGSPEAEYLVVDPYPSDMLRSGLQGLTRVDARPIERLELDPFLQLQAGDVLFIDSGHTVRLGSDVNFLILEVLPRLAPGVVVHFHDIPLPFEYAKIYATNPSFRMFWTESYLLQAFLCHNSEFEIQLAMAYLHHDHPSAITSAFPHYRPEVHRLQSGSLWIRRKTPE